LCYTKRGKKDSCLALRSSAIAMFAISSLLIAAPKMGEDIMEIKNNGKSA
jgi:hypothetical protein